VSLRRASPAVEAAACAAALAALALLVYGPHIWHGGFYWDDWQLAARVRWPPPGQGVVNPEVLAYRPLLALLLPVPAQVLGLHPWAHITLALVLGLASATALFALARRVGLDRLTAGIAAALMLVFPWADSMNIWPTAGLNWLGVLLFELGALVAIAGLRAPIRARRFTLALASAALYLAAILTYEIAAVAILLAVGLYARTAGWRPALRRWPLDVLVVLGGAGFVRANTARSVQTLGGMWEHAKTIGDQALTLLARALEPWGSPPRGIVLGVAALIVGAGLVAWRRGDAVAGRRLAVVAAGIVAVLAAYATLVPADAHYEPLGPGIENRTNLLAAPAYALLVAGTLALAAHLAAGAARRPRAAPAVLALLAVVAGAGYAVKTRGDANDWDRASSEQHRVLDAVKAAVPDPPPRAVIYTAGAPVVIAPGVPVFAVSWDLKGAVRLLYDRFEVRGYPIRAGVHFECAADQLTLSRHGLADPGRSSYGLAILVDVPTATATRIDSRAACRRADARLDALAAQARSATAAARRPMPAAMAGGARPA
jgi:hypothetical protein